MKTIAAQPFDFTFDPAHLALIVIDMQRDFIEPGGFGASLGRQRCHAASALGCGRGVGRVAIDPAWPLPPM